MEKNTEKRKKSLIENLEKQVLSLKNEIKVIKENEDVNFK